MQMQSNSIIPNTIVNKMSYDVKISTSKMTANVRSATIKAHQYFNIIFFMLKLEFIGVVLINTIGFQFLLNGIANHRHGISLIDIRKDMPYHYLPDIRVFFNNVFGEIFVQQNLVICV